jgi:hypothetical protein
MPLGSMSKRGLKSSFVLVAIVIAAVTQSWKKHADYSGA